MEKYLVRSTQNFNAVGKKEIDLMKLVKVIWKKLWLIILVSIIAGGFSYLGCKMLVAPKYRSYFTAYINNTKNEDYNNSLNSSDIMVSQNLVKTYSHIITCRHVLTTSAKDLDMQKSYSELSKMVDVQISDETGIITVNVDGKSPMEANKLATTIKDNSLHYTAEIVEGSTMRIIDDPEVPVAPFSPSYTKAAMLGALAAFLLTVIIICLLRLFNDRIPDEEDLSQHYESIPIVGIIPDVLNAGKNRTDYHYYGKTANKEPSLREINEEGKIHES